MKFAREFQTTLEKGEYPQQWLDSAISYRKLKKCIKKVQLELQSLGLDREALEAIWAQHRASYAEDNDNADSSNGPSKDEKRTTGKSFTPTLLIALDPNDGSPIDAWLSSETRQHLHSHVTRRKSLKPVDSLLDNTDGPAQSLSSLSLDSPANLQNGIDILSANGRAEEDIETVEIPLLGEGEFFAILKRELAQLDKLQETEQDQLKNEIHQLGKELSILKSSNSKKTRPIIEAWREIFRLYIESQIFFSSHEQDAGIRDSSHAENQMQLFNKHLTSEMGREVKLDPPAKAALERFLHINVELLRFIRFQEINLRATSKILKKFDKQTALHSQLIKTQWLSTAPKMANQLAKNTCFTISQELLHLLPQLDDYLCPVCFSITYKPVRLRCEHIFCIRCLIVMQRDEQTDCPLCREKVVMEADSEHIDANLQAFLKANFPKEIKEKQKENEIAAGVDQFGEGFKGTHRCTVM